MSKRHETSQFRFAWVPWLEICSRKTYSDSVSVFALVGYCDSISTALAFLAKAILPWMNWVRLPTFGRGSYQYSSLGSRCRSNRHFWDLCIFDRRHCPLGDNGLLDCRSIAEMVLHPPRAPSGADTRVDSLQMTRQSVVGLWRHVAGPNVCKEAAFPSLALRPIL